MLSQTCPKIGDNVDNVAFIIANGTSRAKYDLLELPGVVYGCNALYRDFSPNYILPHYLVAIDPGMISEIEHSDFPSSRVIIPPHDECWEPADCNPSRPRSNAGINAIREAIKGGHKIIIGLGFDFMLLDESQSVSNIYDGTKNYGMEVRANHRDNFNRANYMNWVAKSNPSVSIFLVYPDIEIRNMHRISAGNIHLLTYRYLDAFFKSAD